MYTVGNFRFPLLEAGRAAMDEYGSTSDIADLPEKAVELAAEILRASRQNESPLERQRSGLMARMMQDEPGKKFTIAMADQVLRMRRPSRAAMRMNSLVEEYGLPKYFASADRWGLRIGSWLARFFPRFVMPFVKSKVRADSAHVIISAEKIPFARYLAERRDNGIRVNFNQLGEAVLGDIEAENRLKQYLDRLLKPGINYCSVKLSSVVSQISLTGYQKTLTHIKEQLRIIYRAAVKGGGKSGPKFVNLDMEEYRDLHLTVDTFKAVLDEPEFEKLMAGIVLQAYLPDSFSVLRGLVDWARARYLRTGVGIKVRLVKGANLAMEQVEASLHDWQQAPYYNKPDVDANYKRMLQYMTQPEHAKYIRVGVASHNLFDIAYAMLLRERRRAQDQVEFEMLEGMANAQAEEVRKRTGDLIVYTPVCFDNEFESAVAYLVRRLDENTAPGSFLGALFALEEGSPAWCEQRDAFLAACNRSLDPGLSDSTNRKTNRQNESIEIESADQPFRNAADTDFSLPENRDWSNQIVEKWQNYQPEPIPIVFGGQTVTGDRLTGVGYDPSRPGHQAYRYAKGTAEDVEIALQVGEQTQKSWEQLGVNRRAEILRLAGKIFAEDRADTIGTMMLDAGKTVVEADVEVSEAIDFANYYSRSLDEQGWFDGTSCKALGVVVITPPWNFPYAIPAGGVIAALMAGNSVILKPARESILTAYQLATQLWKAGVPQDVLQFLPLFDGQTGKKLISDPRTAAVILTGSYFTAAMFQGWRPDLKLYAETSGKNSLIISVAADLDLAIKDLVKGAFGHAGQKCSATSLALVQKEVYDNPRFMHQLKDAAESLHVAGAWDASASVTPVIREPDEYLARGLTQLEPDESWLLEPKMLEDNPCLWRPGIRIGVKPGSWYHKTECFGPVLGLMRVDSLEDAIAIQNSSDFGLTGGLHSLDPKEIDLWREKVEVGNAYINRPTTGAIVQRQPFGGWKDSCVGPGPKAGGPNYVAAFCDWTENQLPTKEAKLSRDIDYLLDCAEKSGIEHSALLRVTAAAKSYTHWWEQEFSVEHDPSQIHGETNHFRYRARPWHVVRVNDPDANLIEMAALVLVACLTTGTNLEFSLQANNESLSKLLDQLKPMAFSHRVETMDEFAVRLNTLKGGSIRVVGSYDANSIAPERIGNIPVVDSQVLANGRIELLNYLKEQSVTETVHRYGNIV